METGETTIGSLERSFSLRSTIPPDEPIHLYGAVIDGLGDMVRTGDFVEVQTLTNDVSIQLEVT